MQETKVCGKNKQNQTLYVQIFTLKRNEAINILSIKEETTQKTAKAVLKANTNHKYNARVNKKLMSQKCAERKKKVKKKTDTSCTNVYNKKETGEQTHHRA